MNRLKALRMIETFQGDHPVSFKACYPRNIVVPAGYSDPKLYAVALTSHLLVVQNYSMSELAHRTSYGISLFLMANRVPTYFVADEFAQAVANTDLPGDFKFAELKWPLEAQLFVLSDKFSEAYYGCTAPFLSVARMKTGRYPTDFRNMPKTDIPLPLVEVTQDRILMDFSFFGSEVPVTYNASYPMKDGVEIFKTAPMNDATLMEEHYYRSIGREIEPKGTLDKDKENEFMNKAQQLAIKLLLTVAELPGLCEHGRVTRHAIVTQQGKTKLPELVSANMIGRTYRIPRKYASKEGASTRAKPRFKYRRGHRVWQAKRSKNTEFIYVDQMPRKVDGFIDFDAAGPELSAKFYACHERMWIEGFFFEDEEDTNDQSDSTPGAKSP